MKQITKAVLALAALGVPPAALAQTYPAKPIRIVSGFPPGGGVDIMARLLSPNCVVGDGGEGLRRTRGLTAT